MPKPNVALRTPPPESASPITFFGSDPPATHLGRGRRKDASRSDNSSGYAWRNRAERDIALLQLHGLAARAAVRLHRRERPKIRSRARHDGIVGERALQRMCDAK